MTRGSWLGLLGVCVGGACAAESASPETHIDTLVIDTLGVDSDTDTDGVGGSAIDDRDVVQAEVPPPPISGGTLARVDASHVIASDPDRDRVFIAAIEPGASVAVVELEPGDEPGRVVVDPHGLAHVALRGGSAIATIDLGTATLLARYPTCVNPRGLAVDAVADRLWVACADGDLIQHELGGPMRARTHVVPDLRDVMLLHDGRVRVTQFRSAWVSDLEDGLPQYNLRPNLAGNHTASTAWRTRMLANDGWVMVHHSDSSKPIDTDEDDAYNGSGSQDCGPPVSTVVTSYQPDVGTRSTPPISLATLPVDVAASPSGDRFAVAVAGQSDRDSPTMQRRASVLLLPSELPPDDDGCGFDPSSVAIDGQITAVEFLDDDRLIAQSREPAGLWVIATDGTDDAWSIPFDAPSRADTGHDLFHQDAGNGLACASCHPEGGDDGFVWTLDDEQRRTLSLRVGLGGTEPFHWSGDFPGFPRIVDEIYAARMGGLELSDARYHAFRDWVYGLAPLRAEPGDPTQVERGAELFAALGCASCHGEAALANGGQAEIGGTWLQVPSLVGIGQRPPYMHDGHANVLSWAVGEMVLEEAPSAELSNDEWLDLIAYVASL